MSSGEPTSIPRLSLATFAQLYGPYAFGVLSLLLIWFSIVKPQLERQSIDFSRHEALLDKLRSFSETQADVARTMERTSIILQNVVEKLDHVEPK